MKNFQFRFVLAVICFASVLLSVNSAFAGPVRLNQVVQTVNAEPGKASTGDFSQLLLVNDYVLFKTDDGDNTVASLEDDDRVITTTKTEIVEEGPCDCEDVVVEKKRFPYWVLGFAAVPLIFLWHKDKKKTPTPTQTIPITTTPTPETPTPTPKTPTPTPKTPTPTPKTPTPTKTPPATVTPTPPEPVPEPMTLLLFGTGLAGIGVAARKRFGKKKNTETEN